MAEGDRHEGSADAKLAAARPGLWLVFKTITILGQLITKLLDRWVVIVAIVALVGGHLGYVYMLPSADRSQAPLLAGIGSAISSVSGSGWFAWAGWGLCIILLVVGGIFVTVQDKRVRDQGTQLAELRSDANPARLSSRDSGALSDYHGRAQKRFSNKDELAEPTSEGPDDG